MQKLHICSVRLKPRICCLDLDTFLVSVERLFRPELIGKPVVVGTTPGKRGVVSVYSDHAKRVRAVIENFMPQVKNASTRSMWGEMGLVTRSR